MGLVEAFQNKTTAVPGPGIPKINAKEEISDYHKTEQVFFAFIDDVLEFKDTYIISELQKAKSIVVAGNEKYKEVFGYYFKLMQLKNLHSAGQT